MSSSRTWEKRNKVTVEEIGEWRWYHMVNTLLLRCLCNGGAGRRSFLLATHMSCITRIINFLIKLLLIGK